MGGRMSKVVVGPVRLEQAQQTDGNAPRPRKAGPVNGRRISMAQGADSPEQLE